MTAISFLTSIMQAMANDAGLIFVFIVIFITGWRKIWVFGHQLVELRSQMNDERVTHMGEMSTLRQEKDQWRAAALWTMGHPSFRGKPPPEMPEIEEV